MRKKFLSVAIFCFMVVSSVFLLQGCFGDKKTFKVNVQASSAYVATINGVRSTSGTFSWSAEVPQGDYGFSIQFRSENYDLENVSITEKSGIEFTKKIERRADVGAISITFVPQEGAVYNFVVGNPQEKVDYLGFDGLDNEKLETLSQDSPVYYLLKNIKVYASTTSDNKIYQYHNIVTINNGKLVDATSNLCMPIHRFDNFSYILTKFESANETKNVFNIDDVKKIIKIKNTTGNVSATFEGYKSASESPLEESGYSYKFLTKNIASNGKVLVDFDAIKDIDFKEFAINNTFSISTYKGSDIEYLYKFKVDGNVTSVKYGTSTTLTLSFDGVEIESKSLSEKEKTSLSSQLQKATDLSQMKFCLNGKEFNADTTTKSDNECYASYNSSTGNWTLTIGKYVAPCDLPTNGSEFVLSAIPDSVKIKSEVVSANIDYSNDFVSCVGESLPKYMAYNDETKINNIVFKSVSRADGTSDDIYVNDSSSTVSSQVVQYDMYMSQYASFYLNVKVNGASYGRQFNSGTDYETSSTVESFGGTKYYTAGTSASGNSWEYLNGDANSAYVRYKVFAYDNVSNGIIQNGYFLRVEIKVTNGNSLTAELRISANSNGGVAQKRTVSLQFENSTDGGFYNSETKEYTLTSINCSAGDSVWFNVKNPTSNVVFDFYSNNKKVFTADKSSQESAGVYNDGNLLFIYGQSSILNYAIDEIYYTDFKHLSDSREQLCEVKFVGFVVRFVSQVGGENEVSQGSRANSTYVVCDKIVVKTIN